MSFTGRYWKVHSVAKLWMEVQSDLCCVMGSHRFAGFVDASAVTLRTEKTSKQTSLQWGAMLRELECARHPGRGPHWPQCDQREVQKSPQRTPDFSFQVSSKERKTWGDELALGWQAAEADVPASLLSTVPLCPISSVTLEPARAPELGLCTQAVKGTNGTCCHSYLKTLRNSKQKCLMSG